MTAGELEAIRTAIADVQTSTDAIGLDVQRVVEIIAWTDTDSPQPPEWVNGDDGAVVPMDAYAGAMASARDDASFDYPPPARGNVGAVAGYVVVAALAAVVVALLVVFFLLGN